MSEQIKIHLLPARTLINIKGSKGEQIGQIRMKYKDFADQIILAANEHERLVAFKEKAVPALQRAEAYLQGNLTGQLYEESDIVGLIQQALAAVEKEV